MENPIIDNAVGVYQPAAESRPSDGVPRGVLSTHHFNESTLLPEAKRDYWVYVPAQYRPSMPAKLMVMQDGALFLNDEAIGFTRVLDNLIACGDIPVMVVVFVDPPNYPDRPVSEDIRLQARQWEYDRQTDHYVRFLMEELLPEVSQHYSLSLNPEDRAIGGQSSGGMCAWNAAWHRPDAFGKVLSFIGSFTDIHGGHNAPCQVRQSPAKPIRVFLQSGENDLNIEWGDWPLANKTMASALAYAGYDYRFVFGNGGHDLQHAAALLPDALRWLWRESE